MVDPVTRASAASRWVPCPEAAWLEQQYPDVENEAAREGIAAHEMGQFVLTNQFLIDELVDRQASNGTMMTGEMIDHVQMYVDHVQSRGVGYWVEESVSIEMRSNQKPVTGKTDSAGFGFDQEFGILYIDDFKYGFGPVEAFENWQLLIYAICIVAKLIAQNQDVKIITMSIIQPRGYHHDGPIRTWTITTTELAGYTEQLRNAVDRVYSSERKCHSGSWCRYCKVLAGCPTAKTAAMNAIDVIMSALPDTDTPDQVADLLDVLKRASDTVKHTYDAITARAEAMISNGKPIPGYAYEPGKGKTKFIDNQQAIDTAICFGIEITDQKTVTPAEAKRRGLPEAVYNSLTTVPSTAPRLVKRDVSTQAKVFES